MSNENPEQKRGAQSITMRPTDSLKPYSLNPRSHSEAQINMIMRSIERFGFTNPILLDGESGIIAGHGRLKAAIMLGLQTVPCIDLHGLEPAEKRAYLIADNQIALQAGWDMQMLAAEIQDLGQAGIDVGLLGFTDAEMAIIESIGVNAAILHWEGMPEFDQESAESFRKIIIHFKDQACVDQFIEATKLPITEKTRATWYPVTEIFHARQYEYEGQSEVAAVDEVAEK